MKFFSLKIKTSLVLLIAAFSLAACSSDEPDAADNNAPDAIEERDTVGGPDVGLPDTTGEQDKTAPGDTTTPDEPDVVEDVSEGEDTRDPDGVGDLEDVAVDPDSLDDPDADYDPDSVGEDVREPSDIVGGEDEDTDDEDVVDEDADTVDEDAGPLPSGNTCEEAIDATDGGEWTRDTRDADDNYNAPLRADNCPSGELSGNDEVFSLAPDVDTLYDIAMTSLEDHMEPLLYVVENCDTPISACIDGSKWVNSSNTVTLNNLLVPAGSKYFVIADGQMFESGPYRMTITKH